MLLDQSLYAIVRYRLATVALAARFTLAVNGPGFALVLMSTGIHIIPDTVEIAVAYFARLAVAGEDRTVEYAFNTAERLRFLPSLRHIEMKNCRPQLGRDPTAPPANSPQRHSGYHSRRRAPVGVVNCVIGKRFHTFSALFLYSPSPHNLSSSPDFPCPSFSVSFECSVSSGLSVSYSQSVSPETCR